MSRRAWIGLLALMALVLSGCSGIPASSSPEVVRTIPQAPSTGATTHITPVPGSGAEDLVRDFLKASLDAEAQHSTARTFLTPNEARRWQDNPTVILNGEIDPVETKFSNDNAEVQIRGRRVGQLDANGVFSPVLKGTGTGDYELFDFRLTRVAGQWRIDVLPPGVLISSSDFLGSESPYHRYALYFYDAQRVLVPDLRYTSLTQQALASWLLAQLLAGPRPELTQTLVSAVPAQADKSSVQLGNPTVVEMPGSGQLLVRDLNDLAVQLAFTLDQVPFSGQLKLTDSGKPVRIPDSSGLEFSKATLTISSASPPPGGPLYFVRDGTVFDDEGKPAPGLLGQPGHNFGSVALRRLAAAQALKVAALTGAGQLQIGSEQNLMTRRLPQPATSRPEWQSSDNVWLGAGNHLYRVVAQDGTVLPISLNSQVGSLPNGTITAVRLSPDGDRVALVIRGPNGIGNAWIGTVITSATDVRVDSLEPITPPALSVTDLAWADTESLLMVAAEPGAEARVWQVYSDGCQLEQKLPNTDLRGTLTSIAAQDQEPVVSAGGLLWKFGNGHWMGLFGTDAPVPGTNPVYAS